MKLIKLTSNKGKILDGPLIIEPEIFQDKRGFFFESWNQATFDKKFNRKLIFSQDNHSYSKKGVLRGLHYQIPPIPQSKLVRCSSGEIFDVAVDIRRNSKTFGEWTSAILNNRNKLMLWIPIGFAHGFLSLKEETEVLYKSSGKYSKNHERTLRWNDKILNIQWPLKSINYENPILSEKDANAPFFNNSEKFCFN